jgi:DNA repair photolyase
MGDEIYGTVRRGWYRRYIKTRVLAHWSVTKPAYRVQLRDGTCLIAGGGHRFLTERGWKFVGTEPGSQRPHLTVNNKLMGTGAFAQAPEQDTDYKRGYLCGMIRGDAHLGSYVYDKRDIEGQAVKSSADLGVALVEPLHLCLPLFDITTGTGDFIANGVISHNCYARPTHEYLGFNAGLDFETRIIVKENAPALFRDFLARASWQPEPIALSGVTDCYQPAERRFRLTRGCLEVAAEARQPMGIITKNVLVLRDLDLLKDLASDNLVRVTLSVTTLKADLARTMEPRTPPPASRVDAIRTLTEANIPVGVLIAPVIPGLNDSEIPAILAAARAAGACTAGYVLLRLPLTVAPVFHEWMEREQPALLNKIEGRVRDARSGKLNNSAFGQRMRGTGEMAEQIDHLFHLFARRHGLDDPGPPLDCTRFRPPRPRSGQLWLF